VTGACAPPVTPGAGVPPPRFGPRANRSIKTTGGLCRVGAAAARGTGMGRARSAGKFRAARADLEAAVSQSAAQQALAALGASTV